MAVKTKSAWIARYFTVDGEEVLNTAKWGKRKAYIFDAKENKALIDKEVEAPESWSDTAVNIAAYKYLRKAGIPTPDGSEDSIRQLISRITNTIAGAGEELGYFESPDESKIFKDELTHLLLYQKGAFNSPVWFNVGLYHSYGVDRPTENFFYNIQTGQAEKSPGAHQHPQCSACFIQKVDDSLEGIFELLKRESRLFKYGSGTGSNFSVLRSKYEHLSSGGTSSGLLSFLKVFDAGAGATKSGGTTRRAAKMVIVNIDHPEIEDFIKWKAKEEDKARALISKGYESDFNGEAYHTISGQNSNNSVRVTDEFMQAYLNDGEWATKFQTTGETHKTYKARDLMRMISESAWQCAEPGMQYDTTINRWHTCKMSGRINGSNPCSEFMFLDDTSCNLASLNLVKFLDEAGNFDIEAFRQAIKVFILAQEIIVDFASYPYEEVVWQSHKFRSLGLGYGNLGAYLMRIGVPYDSETGRGIAAAITSILTGHAYNFSADMAERLGAFSEYRTNETNMLEVIRMHQYAVENIKDAPDNLLLAAKADWTEALEKGKEFGFRNSQTSLLAPTGTIGPLMDLDTTGIEPDFALVKYKKLAGGGGYSIVNQSVEAALEYLGYESDDVEIIKQYILDNRTIEGAPELKDEHLPVFDCAIRCGDGTRFIRPLAHIEMMAAVQPFLSGAISKTVNMPEEATVEEIEEIYITAWRKGLKSLALYRDGCKASQPLTSKKESATANGVLNVASSHREMPRTREGLTHRFVIGGHRVYITANKFKNGDLGEIFIITGKEGSVVSGLLGTIARLSSKMMQEGVLAESIVESIINLRFDPWGMTDNPEIPMAKSIPDYIGRWLGRNFLSLDRQVKLGIASGQEVNGNDNHEEEETTESPIVEQPTLAIDKEEESSAMKYAPSCSACGALMIRNGTCFSCKECGTTSGCS